MQEQERRRFLSKHRPHDRGDSVGWAVAFFWGALILVAQNTNLTSDISWWNGWSVFFTGVGIFALIAVVVRLLVSDYHNPSTWDVIWGLILLGIGLIGIIGTVWVLPLVLIAIGIVILFSALRRNG